MKDEHEFVTLNEKAWMIHSSRNPEVSKKPDAECEQKRESNAQRTQAYHSRRESLMASSYRELGVSVKLDAMFSCHSESSQNTFSERDRSNESGNRFESSVHSVFWFADSANVGTSLLERNKDSFAQSSKVWTFEARTSSGISQQLYRWASATSLCSKIGIGGPHNLLWLLTTAPVSIFPGLASKFRNRSFWTMLLFTIVFNFFWQLGIDIFWWISMLYKSNRVLSWSDSRTLNLYSLSRTSSDGIFDMRGLTYPQCVQTFQDIIGWNL